MTTIRIKTYEEQLVEVQEAITAILTGAQEASYNNQKVRKADLSALQAREEYLQKQIALKKRGGIPVRGATPKRLTAHPDLGKYATILVDGRPLVASAKILVIEYQFPNVAEKANLLENQEGIQNVIESAFGKKMFVYGVSRTESVRVQQNYMNRRQIGKLPKPDTIDIEFEGE